MFSIPSSGIFRGLMRPTLFFTAVAYLAGLYITAQQSGILWSWLPAFNFGLQVRQKRKRFFHSTCLYVCRGVVVDPPHPLMFFLSFLFFFFLFST
jgi:hypothetical protein